MDRFPLNETWKKFKSLEPRSQTSRYSYFDYDHRP